MRKNIQYMKSFITLSLITCLCLSGCGNTDSQTSGDIPEIPQTTETIIETNTSTTETASIPEDTTVEDTLVEESSTEETVTESHTPATIVAYATDIDAAVWGDDVLDIRFPEVSAPDASWDHILPIQLWGETDVIASVTAPLNLDNIKSSGYGVITKDGSTAAFLSDGSAESYIIGYLSQAGTELDYTVTALDTTTLLGSDSPTLQHVLATLGTPDFGFAYDTLEARYYYLNESYYLEVSMMKAVATQAAWNVSEIMYYDSSAFLNDNYEQEIHSVKTSGINGFSSEYLTPEGF